ncbi:GntR family transcriptional regulator [Lentzea tibetensis]|uniref:GntR family transcriptional regulator n=1 Tax=Lentzea tibetensis TaxID=2591470 RepID=A0A563ELK7_9PSEU|nr:GntR family transcriptional regulator [Lentzea tibetensis]TWP48132.1 GntR family transcriptional regulator [Lentzea tibetensis]
MTQPLHLSLAGQALDALRELVLTGEILPGARVNEVEVANRLGISRGPLREAIRGLAAEGLVELVPHKGARVPFADAAEVRALFELRTALECEAAKLAATRRTEQDLDRMRAVSKESRKNYHAGVKFPHRLDLAFHQALLEAARSPHIAEQVRLVQQKVILTRTGLPDDPQHQHGSLDDHDELIELIEQQDWEKAAQIMRRHLSRTCAQIIKSLPD